MGKPFSFIQKEGSYLNDFQTGGHGTLSVLRIAPTHVQFTCTFLQSTFILRIQLKNNILLYNILNVISLEGKGPVFAVYSKVNRFGAHLGIKSLLVKELGGFFSSASSAFDHQISVVLGSAIISHTPSYHDPGSFKLYWMSFNSGTSWQRSS